MSHIKELESKLSQEQSKHKKTELKLRQIEHTKLKDLQREVKEK